MPGSSSRGNGSFSRLALQIERLRPPRHETYSYSSRSTAGHSRLRSISETQTPRRQHHTSEITIGCFLEAVFSVSTKRTTVEGYATAFRKIVADLFGFASDPAKFDYHSGGRNEWLAKVHAIELGKVTPAMLGHFLKHQLRGHTRRRVREYTLRLMRGVASS